MPRWGSRPLPPTWTQQHRDCAVEQSDFALSATAATSTCAIADESTHQGSTTPAEFDRTQSSPASRPISEPTARSTGPGSPRVSDTSVRESCIASAPSPLPLPAPLDRAGSSPRRAEGVGFAVLLCLAAFLHKPRGGFLRGPSPIDCQQAESVIRPADVRPVSSACRWSILHAALIAWPASGAGAACAVVLHRGGFLQWSHNAEGFQFGSCHHLAGVDMDRPDAREIGGVLFLKVKATADAGGS